MAVEEARRPQQAHLVPWLPILNVRLLLLDWTSRAPVLRLVLIRRLSWTLRSVDIELELSKTCCNELYLLPRERTDYCREMLFSCIVLFLHVLSQH